MKAVKSSAFREGGGFAWWLGLRAAILSAKARLAKATCDEERREAQAELDRLHEQQTDAEKNRDRWLF